MRSKPDWIKDADAEDIVADIIYTIIDQGEDLANDIAAAWDKARKRGVVSRVRRLLEGTIR